MFEPLAKLLDKHGNNFKEVLDAMLCHMAMIVENTTSKLEFDQFGTYAAQAENSVTIENKDGCYWEVVNVAVTDTEQINVAVYVGTERPEALVDVLETVKLPDGTFGYGSNHRFYVPPQSTVFIVGKKTVTANLQVRKLREHPEYDRRKTISRDISTVDLRLQEPERHRTPRTEKPKPEDLAAPSYRS